MGYLELPNSRENRATTNASLSPSCGPSSVNYLPASIGVPKPGPAVLSASKCPLMGQAESDVSGPFASLSSSHFRSLFVSRGLV